MIQYFLYPNTFSLESGEKLEQLKIAYSIYGNPQAKETVWVCHALSGNSLVTEWWGGLFGENKRFDFSKYRVICANVIGSCYGSTGPDDLEDPSQFPLITIRDIVESFKLLRTQLNIEKIDYLIGASLGGQQALEWAIQENDKIDKLILIATNAKHSAFGIAFNEAQRLALQADPTFGKKDGGKEGLKAARAIAMLSYRSYDDFEIKQNDDQKSDDFKASSYVRYQGEKFINRFKASAYYSITKTMDSHDVSRNRWSLENVLKSINARTLVVGVDSDLLFPIREQEYLSEHIPNADLGIIRSKHGHDAFLIEYDQLDQIISDFIENDFNNYKPTTLKNINVYEK
ncbi:MAG: homoserine O-acetyltransferase [Crocinitomicaceae bacterium]|nr:homoserine O-acetyltransferase [Crocinitomicaceae bacterium]